MEQSIRFHSFVVYFGPVDGKRNVCVDNCQYQPYKTSWQILRMLNLHTVLSIYQTFPMLLNVNKSYTRVCFCLGNTMKEAQFTESTLGHFKSITVGLQLISPPLWKTNSLVTL